MEVKPQVSNLFKTRNGLFLCQFDSLKGAKYLLSKNPYFTAFSCALLTVTLRGPSSTCLPRLKLFQSKSFVWAPARLFFLLEKYGSAVRLPAVKQAVVLLRVTTRKTPLKASFFLRCDEIITNARTFFESY